MTAFVELYNKGLIYRGKRLVNWCPRCQTALSDLEVVPRDRKGNFWHIVYKVVGDDGKTLRRPDGTEEQIVIATTRPETLLGDTAVAVHPDDGRYTHLHGKQLQLPLLGRLIPLIADAYVDKEFGSGALKVTPAHDFNDYEIGKRHGLPIVSAMGKDGRITSAGGPYSGLRFTVARERVLQDLKEGGLLVRSEDHQHKVGVCQRCESVVEPVVSKQWFVKIQPLAGPAIKAVQDGRIVFTPQSWEKVYFEWMTNIRDWCISRQLWWGHQIPAWYCGRCQDVAVARTAPGKCPKCGAPGAEMRQDEDVLDTWFSSGLWPFSTLGWPGKTQALKTFYPTSIMETGFDIIFFWVARMIMMGIHFMGEVPFKKVYLHAMVRDEKGEKMSKSRGNVIDPLVVIDKHGADPLRFTLSAMSGQGRDVKLSLERVEGYRAFCNKLWNAVKFFHLQYEAAGSPDEPREGAGTWLQHHRVELLEPDKWILSRLQTLVARVEKGLAGFELNDSAQALYEFTWHELCDWYIEFSKLQIKDGVEERKETVITLHHVIETLLRLLHPFMPFVTEELWQSLPWKKSARPGGLVTLMLQPFPSSNGKLIQQDAEKTVCAIRTVVDAVRNFRGENSIAPKNSFPVKYVCKSSAASVFVRAYGHMIRDLAGISELVQVEDGSAAASGDSVVPLTQPPVELRISIKGLVNAEEETKRICKEIERIQSDLKHVRGKLAKESFVAKAPAELVQKERQREQELAQKISELEQSARRLGKG